MYIPTYSPLISVKRKERNPPKRHVRLRDSGETACFWEENEGCKQLMELICTTYWTEERTTSNPIEQWSWWREERVCYLISTGCAYSRQKCVIPNSFQTNFGTHFLQCVPGISLEEHIRASEKYHYYRTEHQHNHTWHEQNSTKHCNYVEKLFKNC